MFQLGQNIDLLMSEVVDLIVNGPWTGRANYEKRDYTTNDMLDNMSKTITYRRQPNKRNDPKIGKEIKEQTWERVYKLQYDGNSVRANYEKRDCKSK